MKKRIGKTKYGVSYKEMQKNNQLTKYFYCGKCQKKLKEKGNKLVCPTKGCGGW